MLADYYLVVVRARCYVLVLLGLLLALVGVVMAAEVSLPSTHLLGTVIDSRGKPLPGALVGIVASRELYQLGRVGQPLYVRADDSGRFDLMIPSSLGTAIVVARRDGLLPARSAAIALNGPRQPVPPLQLLEGLKLSGRVIDEQRQPIPGAVVQATVDSDRGDTIRGQPRQVLRTTARRDGTFTLGGMDIGSFTITAYGSSHALWRKYQHKVDASPASRQLQITLERGVFLSGKVQDVGGQPLAGVTVADSALTSTIVVTSDAQGRFRLGPFTANQLHGLDAKLTGYTPLRQDYTAPANDLVLILNRNAGLRGRVVDADTNQPVSTFELTIDTQSRNRGQFQDMQRRRAFTAADGRFEVPQVYAGPWNISVRARGYQPWEMNEVEFQGGATRELVISLQKGLTLRGRVIEQDSGKALAGAVVSFERNQPYSLGAPEGTTVTADAAGAFALEGVPPGIVVVRARAAGHLRVEEKVNVETQGFIELVAARGASIRGQVLTMEGDIPVSGMVTLSRGGGSHGYGTDAAGRFVFAAELPGRYMIAAKTDTGRSEPQEVTLAEGQELTGLILRVRPAASVLGRLSGVSAAELAVARVTASDFRAEQLDAAALHLFGTFTIPDLTGGDYQLVLHRAGYDIAEQRIKLTGSLSDLEVPMRPAEGVRLQVRDGVNAEAIFAVQIKELAGAGPAMSLWLRLDQNGVCRLPPSLAGRSFAITARDSQPVTVANWNGAPLDVVLQFPVKAQ